VFVASGLGLGALWRRRLQHGPGRESVYQPPYDDGTDPAAELRAKLAETKSARDDDAPQGEPEDEGSPLDPQSRRRDVHERARASIDELG